MVVTREGRQEPEATRPLAGDEADQPHVHVTVLVETRVFQADEHLLAPLRGKGTDL